VLLSTSGLAFVIEGLGTESKAIEATGHRSRYTMSCFCIKVKKLEGPFV